VLRRSADGAAGGDIHQRFRFGARRKAGLDGEALEGTHADAAAWNGKVFLAQIVAWYMAVSACLSRIPVPFRHRRVRADAEELPPAHAEELVQDPKAFCASSTSSAVAMSSS